MKYNFALETKDGEPTFNASGGRTPEFMAATHAVEDYLNELVKVLPIKQEQLDKLCGLMTENVVQAEKGAFHYGLAFGMKLSEPSQKKPKRGNLA